MFLKAFLLLVIPIHHRKYLKLFSCPNSNGKCSNLLLYKSKCRSCTKFPKFVGKNFNWFLLKSNLVRCVRVPKFFCKYQFKFRCKKLCVNKRERNAVCSNICMVSLMTYPESYNPIAGQIQDGSSFNRSLKQRLF